MPAEWLDVDQNSDEWFALRRGIPTASEFGKIITPKTGVLSARSDEYIGTLIGETIEQDDSRFQTYWMERGKVMEQEAASWYQFQYDVKLEKAGIVLNYGAGYSPDRHIKRKCGIEFKCPKASTLIKWILAGGLPDEHRPQVHAGLYIAELRWVDFVAYHPDIKPLVVRVEPDDYTVKVGKALAQFIERYMKAQEIILQ